MQKCQVNRKRLGEGQEVKVLYVNISIIATVVKRNLSSIPAKWENSVQKDDSIPKQMKKQCVLPHQTIEGLKFCGMYMCTKISL